MSLISQTHKIFNKTGNPGTLEATWAPVVPVYTGVFWRQFDVLRPDDSSVSNLVDGLHKNK